MNPLSTVCLFFQNNVPKHGQGKNIGNTERNPEKYNVGERSLSNFSHGECAKIGDKVA